MVYGIAIPTFESLETSNFVAGEDSAIWQRCEEVSLFVTWQPGNVYDFWLVSYSGGDEHHLNMMILLL